MTANPTPMLVDVAWLKKHLDDKNVRVLDCTTHMIAQPVGASRIESGKPDFEQAHIRGACHVDMVTDLSDTEGIYPYTILQKNQFERLAQRLGLHEDDHVVLYAQSSITTLTRAWFVFHALGHKRVSVLNGNKSYWASQEGELTTDLKTFPKSDYQAAPASLQYIAQLEDVRQAMASEQSCLLNALSREQFLGIGGAHYGRPGHIPGSLHLAARSLVDSQTGRFLPQEELVEMVQKAGLRPNQRVIHYCGGGIAASTTAFVLALLGWTDWALYDNSLLEWSTRTDTPMTGP